MSLPDRENVSGPASPPEPIKLRADFLRAAQARRVAFPGFVLQARNRSDGDARIRVGFTCSKKVGNAVARNRAKRRLREVARLDLGALGQPGWDYVLIGRKSATASLPFSDLRNDLARGLKKLHRT